MLDATMLIVIALAYVGGLFVIAWIGVRVLLRSPPGSGGRPLIYSLSIAVYCTSWTYFGSVGLSARTGYDFIPVYLGPILMFTLGLPVLMRIVRVAKGQNITSVADFIAARYGKSQTVAALVTVVAVVGSLPYIALQLKAIAVTMETLIGNHALLPVDLPRSIFNDTAFLITVALSAFAILFGTRHGDATEHQQGLILAIATESLVKLAAFLAVGLFVTFAMAGGPQALLAQAAAHEEIAKIFGQSFHGGTWLTVGLLSAVCIVLLPRQFHVAIVENNSESELRRAAWMFPLYLVLINIFVVPLAAAGLLFVGSQGNDPDFYVLTLPVSAGAEWMSLVAFIGGLSAATAMVIVESIALAIMLSNGVIIPLLVRYHVADIVAHGDMARLLLTIRRVAIVGVLFLAYLVFSALGESQGLAAIGLVSFAAIAQLAPAFFGGLFWGKGTSSGALAGISIGFLVWGYTLLLPWVAKAGLISHGIVENGPFGFKFLRPQALFFLEFEPLTHGVLWSIGANIIAYVMVSLVRAPTPIERIQAQQFLSDEQFRSTLHSSPSLRMWRSPITIDDLQSTVARYLGEERTVRSFSDYASANGVMLIPSAKADIQIMRFAERLLASSIGAASSRLVLALLLARANATGPNALRLLDDASEALHYNRDLLQSAIDQVRQGLSVFDKDMRLICWNRQFREMLDLPADLAQVGIPLDRILEVLAERGDFGQGNVKDLVSQRLIRLAVTRETFQEQVDGGRRIVEIRTSTMPQGGIVTTYSDVTDRIAAASALARANENLERRVRERTAELLDVNAALAVAKTKADEANLDKTRFLAAASHDIMQPLNAARLYVQSLSESSIDPQSMKLVRNVDASLNAVEEIFSTLIEISRMDARRVDVDITDFPLSDIFEQLKLEFEPVARERGLAFTVLPTNVWVRSDRRLLRRVLQNLVSNAVKYTRTGKVVLGLRRRGEVVSLQVLDTGPGIPEDKRRLIFHEFQRIEGAGSREHGLGLGLSIVERICLMLGHPLELNSEAGKGSMFSVVVPLAVPVKETRTTVVPARKLGSPKGSYVLCIDNEPAVLAGMEALLGGWGCKVTTATSIPTSVQAASSMPALPDVILADYHLDLGTGLAAIAAVRDKMKVDIPAVIITADHSAEVERHVREAGHAILRKPLKAAALRALMTRLLMQTPTAAQ